MFVSIEGPEGAGKSTLARQIQERLLGAGYRALLTYEPGGTALGRAVRAVVVHGHDAARLPPGGPIRDAARAPAEPDARGEPGRGAGQSPDAASKMGTPLTPRTETLLFCAARAQLVDEVIRPHLQRGGIVICDRYADSTLAYQCYGRGLPLPPVRAVLEFATDGLWPDLTVLLDVDVREGLRRKEQIRSSAERDRFESQEVEFHERVRQGYRALAAAEPQRWLVVDATMPFDRVLASVWDQIGRRLKVGGTPLP